MSEIKTFPVALLVLFCTITQASDRSEHVEIVASCVERISALEFTWLLSNPKADAYEGQRTHLVEILEATSPLEDKRHQLALRIETKLAHAELLNTAYFHKDGTRSAWVKQ